MEKVLVFNFLNVYAIMSLYHIVFYLSLLNVLAAMSPGPDMAVVVQHVLDHGRRAGIWTAVGIASALLVHMTYSAFGLVPLLKQHHYVMIFLGFLGGSYMLFLGLRVWCASSSEPEKVFNQSSKNFSARRAWQTGLLTNLLNPKAVLFIVSMFTLIASYHLNVFQKIGVVFFLSCTSLLWFVVLSLMISHPRVYGRFLRYQTHIKQIMGVLLILFAGFIYVGLLRLA